MSPAALPTWPPMVAECSGAMALHLMPPRGVPASPRVEIWPRCAQLAGLVRAKICCAPCNWMVSYPYPCNSINTAIREISPRLPIGILHRTLTIVQRYLFVGGRPSLEHFLPSVVAAALQGRTYFVARDLLWSAARTSLERILLAACTRRLRPRATPGAAGALTCACSRGRRGGTSSRWRARGRSRARAGTPSPRLPSRCASSLGARPGRSASSRGADRSRWL